MDIKFKLEGALQSDCAKKVLCFKFIENQRFTMWLCKNQTLSVKLNEHTDIKTISLDEFK
jgi:hypothetical protein